MNQPIEEPKNWAKDNQNRLPAGQISKLKGIINAIEAGPKAGKPLAISGLKDHQIQKISGLRGDRDLDISRGAKGH
jgi:hypothetical protein